MKLKSFLCLICATFSAHAAPMLVLDMRNVAQLPKHFRTSSDSLSSSFNTTGLTDLHVVGSAQFSKAALEKVAQRIDAKQLTIIDLRQESHGFLNGNAVSWYSPRNKDNAGKTMEQINTEQQQLLDDLSKEKFVSVNVILKKNAQGKIAKSKNIDFAVHQTANEAQIANALHMRYYRLYVQDGHAPSAKEVERFIHLVRELPRDRWLYFHCRGGSGRTTLFMTMYDMLHNAKSVSFADIMARQAALGGKDLTKLPARDSYKYATATARVEFLKKFYQYAHDNKNDFTTYP